jgi:hypothetical protein
MEALDLRIYRDALQPHYGSTLISDPPAVLQNFQFGALDLLLLWRYTVVWPAIINSATGHYVAGISRRPLFATKAQKDAYAAQEIFQYATFVRLKEGPFWQPETSTRGVNHTTYMMY